MASYGPLIHLTIQLFSALVDNIVRAAIAKEHLLQYLFLILQKIETDAKTNIDTAVKGLANEHEIPMTELSADIYSNCLEPLVRNVLPDNPLHHINLSKPQNM